jgi:hypothetical protein
VKSYDDEKTIGAVTIVSRTDNINMLDERDDMIALWDIRVSDTYKHKGVGQKLWSGLKTMALNKRKLNVKVIMYLPVSSITNREQF